MPHQYVFFYSLTVILHSKPIQNWPVALAHHNANDLSVSALHCYPLLYVLFCIKDPFHQSILTFWYLLFILVKDLFLSLMPKNLCNWQCWKPQEWGKGNYIILHIKMIHLRWGFLNGTVKKKDGEQTIEGWWEYLKLWCFLQM